MSSHAFASLFEDFNPPAAPANAVDLPPPEPTFSADELAAARLEGWNDGYLAASTSKAHDTGRDEHQVFASMLARSDELDRWLGQMAEQNAAAIARWLVTAFTTAFPGLSNGPMTGRGRSVMEVLQSALRSQSKIEVRDDTGDTVSFHTLHDACRQIETRQTENPTGGNIVIAWQQGEARIDTARTWEDILQAIMPLAADATLSNTFQVTGTQRESTSHVG